MTTHNTQDQDLRTALEGDWAAQIANRLVGRPYEDIAEELRRAEANGHIMGHAAGSLAAPPRPVDAERVGLFDRQPKISEVGHEPSLAVILRSYYGEHFPDEQAASLAEHYMAALASPAHSPDKAVTREGVAEAGWPGVDRNVVSAARDLCAEKKAQPEWLWFERETGIVGFGRWAKLPEQAPYVRADLALATKPTGTEAGRGVGVEADLAASVAETVKETGGWWKSCSGCHETNEGHETGHYPYSGIFRCRVGSGCRECGGLGVRWEHYSEADFAAMAEDIATPTPPVSPSPDSTGPNLARLSKVCAQAISDANITNCRADEALPVVEAILAALTPSDSAGQGDALAEVITALDAAGIQECHVDGDKADVISAPPGSNYQNEHRVIARCATGDLWRKQAVAIAKSINFVRSLATVSQGDAQTQEGGR